MSEEKPSRRIPVMDRRVSQRPSGSDSGDGPPPTGPDASASGLGVDGPHGDVSIPTASGADTSAQEHHDLDAESTVAISDAGAEQEKQDFLDDLRRLQADFDNYRKRMAREQAATASRATGRVLEQLLPVLDDCERALEHEGGGSTELIYKSLRTVLEGLGLEEIPAEGVPFDPHVHEAVDSREDPEVTEIVCRSVFRRGYRLGDQVLRAAMVVVARPSESQGEQGSSDSSKVAGG